MKLVGDIGGTHTRLAMARVSSGRVQLDALASFPNADAADLESLLSRYLEAMPEVPDSLTLAVAGPTDGQHAQFTNLAWRIDTTDLQRRFGKPARLLNDFVAVGHGLAALGPEDLHTLQEGVFDAAAPRLAVGAGTGLGVVQCLPDDTLAGLRLRPLASEGGHIGFAPADAEQAALLAFMQAELIAAGISPDGRVSVERLCSGPGIEAIYRFCRQGAGRTTTRPRPADEVSAHATDQSDPQAIWAMRLFARIYGQVAGDLALVTQARGGVYLAGGIAPKNRALLESGAFLEGFRAKGRFSDWMGRVPVYIVLDASIGLKGAALAAD